MRKSINEFVGYFDNYQILGEMDEAEKKRRGVLLKVGGVFQAEDAKNKNNRIYPSETWDEVFRDREWTERLTNRGILGEVDHPTDGGKLRRTSHIITKLERKRLNGKKVIYGEAEILDTPDGKVMETLFRAGARVGISSRGEGSVESDASKGADMVQKDYRPDGWDFVTKPSTFGAFPSPLTEEEQKENTKVVVQALADLVERTQDKKTLLSCYQTLNEYKGDAGSLYQKLEEKLVDSPPDNSTSAGYKSLNDDKEVNPMGSEQEKLFKEAQAELVKMARDLAQADIEKTKKEYEEKYKALESKMTDVASRLEDKTKALEAAEKIIDEYTSKVKEMEEAGTDSTQTKERLEAARKLIAACMEMIDELKDAKEYGEAAEQVAQALLDKQKDDEITKFIDGVLVNVESEDVKESVKSLVEGVETLEEAKARLSALSKLIPNDEAFKPLTEEELEEAVETKATTKPRSFSQKLRQRVAG